VDRGHAIVMFALAAGKARTGAARDIRSWPPRATRCRIGAMPDPVETPQEIWAACVAYGDLLFTVHDQVPWQRARRWEGYAGWRLSPPMADGLATTLLALRLHTLSHDAAVATGRPLTRDDLAGLPLADVAARSRPDHELFAGLAAVALDAERAHWVNVLKLLTYERPGSALVLARLHATVQTTVDVLQRRYRTPALTLLDLSSAADDG
jgi:hypothetical protein